MQERSWYGHWAAEKVGWGCIKSKWNLCLPRSQNCGVWKQNWKVSLCLSWPEAILQSFEHKPVQISIECLIVRIRTGFLGNVSYVFSNAPQLINTNAIFTCLCCSVLQTVYSARGDRPCQGSRQAFGKEGRLLGSTEQSLKLRELD